ncbi:30S ribosomal protein S4, partial [Candidatus Woesearchaeota archaeon CG10_big_fil_rev_8_21_14_0_10_47_5]
MGDPRKIKKKYSTPIHPWQRARIEEEGVIIKDHGLKNKKEV